MENLEFRKKLLEESGKRKMMQLALKRACAESCLFFLNSFSWTYNPKKPNCPVIPFLTWPYQDRGFAELNGAVDNQHDVLIEKSRDMGASWMCDFVFLWRWLYRSHNNFFIMSRVSDLVDKPGDPKSLFWKLDFCLKYLPRWMVPEYVRTDMHLGNMENGSNIDGSSTTAAAGVGGRATAAFFDEFSLVKDAQSVWAQSADMTDCRIFNGTPNGTANKFYELTRMKSIVKVRFHWSDHPEKGKGLYFDAAGKARSPWYDAECERRGNNKREISAQLDIDYQGASYQFFDPDEIDRLKAMYACQPYRRGELDGDRFVDQVNGLLFLWCHLDGNVEKPAEGRYAIGADVATGSGGDSATNSVATVVNIDTGEKVAEFATPYHTPDKFADYVVDLAHWFREAIIIWEDIGPGTIFRNRMQGLGYTNLYRRQNEKTYWRDETNQIGWYPSPENKDMAYGELRRAMTAGEFTNRSEFALDECKNIVFGDDGHIGHSGALKKGDPTGAKVNHSDRVMADALAWKICSEAAKEELEKPEDGPPIYSLAWRREQRDKEEAVIRRW